MSSDILPPSPPRIAVSRELFAGSRVHARLVHRPHKTLIPLKGYGNIIRYGEAGLSLEGKGAFPLAGSREGDPMKKAWKYLIAGAILSAVLLAGIAAAQGGTITLAKNGNIVTISGTTNLATGDRLIVSVVSAAFTPTEKGKGVGFSGAAGTAIVQPGTPLNSFSFDVNVSAFPPGEYLVTVESVEIGFRESSEFVLPWAPVPTPVTTVPTTVPATGTTPPVSTTAPSPPRPTPTPLSGFLALGASAGAVYLLARRH